MKSICACILSVSFLLIGVSCATKPPVTQFSKAEGRDIEQAAKSGDAERVKILLAARDSISEADRYNLIFSAVADECHPEVVRLIFQKNGEKFDSNISKAKDDTFADRLAKVGEQIGVGKKDDAWSIGLPERPAAKLVEITAKHFCPDALMMIAEKTSAEDFAIGIYQRSTSVDIRVKGATNESFLEVFQKRVYRDNETDESSQNILSVSKFIGSRIQSDCSKFGGEPCKAKAAFNVTAQKLQSYAKARVYEESPDGILDQACESYGNIEHYLNLIKEENEKGKISGYVNKVSLKYWGDQVYRHRREFDALNAEYKSKSKKSINPKRQCGV
ncbi:hypothetical protein D3C87_339290 [compost metagenome]